MHKSNKHKTNSVSLLDNKHKEFMDDFLNDITDIIPKLKLERQKLKHKLKKCTTIEQQLDYTDKINEITLNIQKIKYKQKNYYLNNSKYIFEYFENKKNISSGSSNNNNNNLLNSFFKIKDNNEKEEEKDEKDNKNIVQKYLNNIDTFVNMDSYVYSSDICKYCLKGELITIEDEGVMICKNCSKTVSYLIENEKSSYKEPPKEISFYAYKKINHFKEIISQFQGKETTQIPTEVIENIKLQIKKERIQLSDLTRDKIKEFLKKLGYNKYYEHIAFIKDKLGIKPPIMSPELEEKLFNLFIEIQAPYSEFCPDYRVNFLNYYYTAYKLCELLKEYKYLKLFPMLKYQEKINEQDDVWKKICKKLDWEFKPTILEDFQEFDDGFFR